MKQVEIFTDGACSGNPGKGGWGAVLRYNGAEKELCGGAVETTNNRMELTAVIEALRALKEPCKVTLTTDSKYVVDAIEKSGVYSWKQNGWRKADKKPALNVDLWETLLTLTQKNEVTFHKVAGHADNALNNRCDELARGAIVELRKTLPVEPVGEEELQAQE
jgi:ribonuclease HI